MTYTQEHAARQNNQSKPPVKAKISGVGIFFAVILLMTLITLQVRGLYDINRFFNPYFKICDQAAVDESVVCPNADYALQRFLWWSYLSGPLFLLFLILTVSFRKKITQGWQRALFIVFALMSYFLGAEILAYSTVYMFEFHKDYAWYFTLGIIAVLSVVLVVYVDRKQAAKLAAKRTGH